MKEIFNGGAYNLLNLMPIFAEDTAETTAASGTSGLTGMLTLILPFGVIILLMYFMMIRPQKKKEKEEQKMRNNIRVGDEITTIGGICGRILNIKEDSFVIETGADRSKMTVKKWAVQSVQTVHDTPAASDDDDDDDI